MSFSADFSDHTLPVGGLKLFYKKGGPETGPLTLLLHGHTQTSDMWAPLANRLAEQGRQVIAVDLHGLGRSSAAPGRYDKKTMAVDFHSLIETLFGADKKLSVIGHDLGVFAAYAFAAQFPRAVNHLILMDATVPGIGAWPLLLQQPRTWHFGFYGPHAVKLIEGRERIYLDRFWDEFALNPKAISDAKRELYTSYYQSPGRVVSALAHFEVFEADALDNQTFAKAKLKMPVLGLGGSHSLGPMMPAHLPLIADNFASAIIDNAGHWVIEENPRQTIETVEQFLNGQ